MLVCTSTFLLNRLLSSEFTDTFLFLSGVLFEPIQSVIQMHYRAGEIGCQIGNLSLTAIHKMFHYAREFWAGTNLLQMKTDLERDLKAEEYHESFPLLSRKLNIFHHAVMILSCESLPPDLGDRSNGSLWDSEASVSTHILNHQTTSTSITTCDLSNTSITS
jgi:hypothetical protein